MKVYIYYIVKIDPMRIEWIDEEINKDLSSIYVEDNEVSIKETVRDFYKDYPTKNITLEFDKNKLKLQNSSSGIKIMYNSNEFTKANISVVLLYSQIIYTQFTVPYYKSFNDSYNDIYGNNIFVWKMRDKYYLFLNSINNSFLLSNHDVLDTKDYILVNNYEYRLLNGYNNNCGRNLQFDYDYKKMKILSFDEYEDITYMLMIDKINNTFVEIINNVESINVKIKDEYEGIYPIKDENKDEKDKEIYEGSKGVIIDDDNEDDDYNNKNDQKVLKVIGFCLIILGCVIVILLIITVLLLYKKINIKEKKDDDKELDMMFSDNDLIEMN